MDNKLERLEANSYCIEYENGEFFIGFADKSEKEEVDLKAFMYCNDEDFKSLFRSILKQVAKFNKDTGRNFISELYEEEGLEVE